MKDQQIFFALLRAAIWSEPADVTIPDGYDWEPMIEAFRQHALLGVVANVILALPEEKRPKQPLQDKLLTHVAALVRQRFRMRQVIPELFAELEKVSHPVLLKGEGLAELYPKSAHRSVGDIDVYVGPRDFESACAAVDRLNGLEPEAIVHNENNGHHYETTYQGQELEIHLGIANTRPHEFDRFDQMGELYNRWAEQTLQQYPPIPWQISGTTILLPPVQFDVFFIFWHMAKHLHNQGGALRQMLDWALYLHVHHDYDESELKKILKASHHLYTWQVLSGVLHYQFGLPKGEIPFYNERLARRSQGLVVTNLVEAGNFGYYMPTPDDPTGGMSHGLSRTLAVAREMWQSYRKSALVFPYFARYFYLKALRVGVREQFKRLFHL